MTIGIYLLSFNGTDKVYIGQSINIEKRYKEHLWALPAGRENAKITKAYSLYGNPTLAILEECTQEYLSVLETQYIHEFDSYHNGFNSSKEAIPVSRGEKHFNSIYTNEKVYSVLQYLIRTPILTAREIAEELNVTKALVQSISSLVSHCWLKDSYPEDYSKLETMYHQKTRVSTSHSLKNKNNKYPLLKSPTGELFIIDNAAEFSRQHNLNSSHIISVLCGRRKSHKGWVARIGDIS